MNTPLRLRSVEASHALAMDSKTLREPEEGYDPTPGIDRCWTHLW